MDVNQHYLYEARQLQALSLSVHIPLVCFGIAFPVLVLFAEWRYLRTGDELYRTLARRWSRIMLALFAVGVVTGTILSFELGLLWPVWMQDFGNVFGLGFTLEGFSFFVEAIFIGIYAYGWDRLSPRLHLLSGIPIALAGVAGSLFVISVNGWMNHPTGFTLVDGRATDVHPWSALFANPMFWSEYIHMYFAAFIVCGFLLAGAYAWAFLRGRRGRYERTALAITLSTGAVAAPLQVIVGDWAARDVAVYQPVKLAAMEGLATTTRGAAEHLLGWYNGHAVVWGIEIPKLLSLLAFHNPNAVVKGLDIVPLSDQPPVNVVRFAFQTMVGIGSLLALIGLVYLYLRFRRKGLPRWLLYAVVAAGPLSVVALIAGWITTEVGRQPWIVYDVMRVDQAVTGASDIPIGYGTLSVVYLVLAGIVFLILRRLARIPLPAELADPPGVPGSPGATRGLRARRLHPRRDGGVHGAGRRRLRRRALDAARLRALGAARAGSGQARHGAGVGGQPRLADLRPRGGLDGVPGGLRLDHLHPFRAAADRGDRDHLPRGRVRAARPAGLLPGRPGGGAPVRGLLGAHAVRARHGGRGDRHRPGARGERGGEPGDLVALPRPGARRGARRDVLRVPGGRVPRRRLEPVRRERAGGRLPLARPCRRRRVRGAGAGRAARDARVRAGPDARGRAGAGVRVRRRRAGHDGPVRGVAVRARPADGGARGGDGRRRVGGGAGTPVPAGNDRDAGRRGRDHAGRTPDRGHRRPRYLDPVAGPAVHAVPPGTAGHARAARDRGSPPRSSRRGGQRRGRRSGSFAQTTRPEAGAESRSGTGAQSRPEAGAEHSHGATRRFGAAAVLGLVGGAGLLVFTNSAWTHLLGVAGLLLCAVAVFTLTATPLDR